MSTAPGNISPGWLHLQLLLCSDTGSKRLLSPEPRGPLLPQERTWDPQECWRPHTGHTRSFLNPSTPPAFLPGLCPIAPGKPSPLATVGSSLLSPVLAFPGPAALSFLLSYKTRAWKLMCLQHGGLRLLKSGMGPHPSVSHLVTSQLGTGCAERKKSLRTQEQMSTLLNHRVP